MTDISRGHFYFCAHYRKANHSVADYLLVKKGNGCKFNQNSRSSYSNHSQISNQINQIERWTWEYEHATFLQKDLSWSKLPLKESYLEYEKQGNHDLKKGKESHKNQINNRKTNEAMAHDLKNEEQWNPIYNNEMKNTLDEDTLMKWNNLWWNGRSFKSKNGVHN